MAGCCSRRKLRTRAWPPAIGNASTRWPSPRSIRHCWRRWRRRGRTKGELDEVIRWLTGYSQEGLEAEIAAGTNFETFFAKAPRLNPARGEIKGLICGQRVEEIQEPLTREIRYLDKLIDELAKGKAMEKVLRHRA